MELGARGFTLIQEDDAVILRQRVETCRPFTTVRPVMIITQGHLEDLPYDLFQPARRINLSLHQFFPNLAYPVLQVLTPDQLGLLANCPQPTETLSRQKTIDYLLKVIFQAMPEGLSQPSELVNWLSRYHQGASRLPDLLCQSLVAQLQRFAIYKHWSLDRLIQSKQAFHEFVQTEWQMTVDRNLSGQPLHETDSPYYLIFEQDPALQDLVPTLVRRDVIRPLEVINPGQLPDWVQSGIAQNDYRPERFNEIAVQLQPKIKALSTNGDAAPITTWSTWQTIAQDWAALCILRHQPDLALSEELQEKFVQIQKALDEAFPLWLQRAYATLGAQRLPEPRHVYHIPHYLAHQRELHKLERLVLLVLDGLSLADWQIIQAVWGQNHPAWEFTLRHLLAQIPTITSISRYGLISGLRPANYAATLERCPSEVEAWRNFWKTHNIPETACGLRSLSLDRNPDMALDLEDPRVSFWCLIENTPDELAHHATLGATDQQNSLQLWLNAAHEPNSIPLEQLIDRFINRGFAIFIASDHGHVEATGIGQPNEGILTQTRGKRARIYQDINIAQQVKTAFPDSILWDNDGLLPDGLSVLMPTGRNAFAINGSTVVTHGGLSIEEVVVPFIQIKKAS